MTSRFLMTLTAFIVSCGSHPQSSETKSSVRIGPNGEVAALMADVNQPEKIAFYACPDLTIIKSNTDIEEKCKNVDRSISGEDFENLFSYTASSLGSVIKSPYSQLFTSESRSLDPSLKHVLKNLELERKALAPITEKIKDIEAFQSQYPSDLGTYSRKLDSLKKQSDQLNTSIANLSARKIALQKALAENSKLKEEFRKYSNQLTGKILNTQEVYIYQASDAKHNWVVRILTEMQKTLKSKSNHKYSAKCKASYTGPYYSPGQIIAILFGRKPTPEIRKIYVDGVGYSNISRSESFKAAKSAAVNRCEQERSDLLGKYKKEANKIKVTRCISTDGQCQSEKRESVQEFLSSIK